MRFILGVAVGLVFLAGCFAAEPNPKKGTGDKDAILKRFVEEFVTLTPGQGKFPASFPMGSADADAEKPVHKVTFKKPFAVNRYEVTQELYAAVMGHNPSKWQGPRNSVEMVTWDDAVAFCTKATAELRRRKLIGDDEEIRLPRRHHDGVRIRRQGRGPARLRLVQGQLQGRGPAGRRQEAQRLGPVRHARLRLGVVPGHLAAGL
jgi:hypothetical protein